MADGDVSKPIVIKKLKKKGQFSNHDDFGYNYFRQSSPTGQKRKNFLLGNDSKGAGTDEMKKSTGGLDEQLLSGDALIGQENEDTGDVTDFASFGYRSRIKTHDASALTHAYKLSQQLVDQMKNSDDKSQGSSNSGGFLRAADIQKSGRQESEGSGSAEGNRPTDKIRGDKDFGMGTAQFLDLYKQQFETGQRSYTDANLLNLDHNKASGKGSTKGGSTGREKADDVASPTNSIGRIATSFEQQIIKEHGSRSEDRSDGNMSESSDSLLGSMEEASSDDEGEYDLPEVVDTEP